MKFPLRTSFPDLASFEAAERLAKELKLEFRQELGPKDSSLEGLRVAEIMGRPDKLAQFQDLFALEVSRMHLNRQKMVLKLWKSWSLSP
jgi:hypothetical protein